MVPFSYGPASTTVKPALASSGASVPRMALPSASLGYSTPIFLLVGSAENCEVYDVVKLPPPNEKWYVHLNGDGAPGLAPRPKYQASHGITVDRQGTPAASHASDTGFTVSGVVVVSMRSILSLLISALASWLARAGSDCVSRSRISTAYFTPPMVRPAASVLRTCARMKVSVSPRAPSGPVRGLMKPTLSTGAAPAAWAHKGPALRARLLAPAAAMRPRREMVAGA